MNNITFIGAGSMAEAILSGLTSSNVIQAKHIFVTNKSNKSRLHELHKKYNVNINLSKQQSIKNSNIIILSMKPKDLESSLQEINSYITKSHLVISILAGISENQIRLLIGKDIPIVRVMPNTSATVKHSMTGISKGKFANEHHLHTTTKLFESVGKTITVPEEHLHGVTSLSGSGSAYFYFMVESLINSYLDIGLDFNTAEKLVVETFIGAGKLLNYSDGNYKKLRENITSTGGTTDAGVSTLKDLDFESIVKSCVKSAYTRSVELSKNN